MKAENKKLRELLWLRHGCPSYCLYGDDGEIQCNCCMIDFKRDPVEKIEGRFIEIGMQKYREYINKIEQNE